MRRSRKFLLPLLLCALVGCGGSWSSGDRVLVAKFLYDSDLMPPHRYDVVVFKYPRMPLEKGTPKNYIKRLLGLPGELIAIFFGRLYHYSPEKVPYDYNKEIPPNDLWKSENLLGWSTQEEAQYAGRLDDLSPIKKAARELVEGAWKDKKLTILRKPLDTMMALRRIVYDNDKQARDLKGVLPPRWQPWSAWVPDEPNGFKIDPNEDREHWLRYQHILRPADWPMQPLNQGRDAPLDNRRQAELKVFKDREYHPQLITDFMGYNTYETPRQLPARPPNWVGDLMLECKLTVTEAKGECWLELSKGVDRFQARINLETGVCTLYRLSAKTNQGPLEQEKLSSAMTRIKATGHYQVRFANIDERLTLWVDSDLPFNEGHTYEGPQKRGPDRHDAKDNNDLQPASIASKGARIQVHQLKLWRDTYYTLSPQGPDGVPEGNEGGLEKVDWSNPNNWGPLRKIGHRGIYVYPGHYLCLGDNSPESSDSREWGLVPERLMLGRALLVYFPFERVKMIK